jgi:hypothetical protein
VAALLVLPRKMSLRCLVCLCSSKLDQDGCYSLWLQTEQCPVPELEYVDTDLRGMVPAHATYLGGTIVISTLSGCVSCFSECGDAFKPRR